MKRIFGFCLLVVCCASCRLFSDLRKRTFTYTENDRPQTLRLVVPKRYAKSAATTDSAGNQQKRYSYSNGAFLYVIRATDTLTQFQPIDTAANIPRPHPLGGQMYKGVDADGRFWRELRTDSFRFGYRFVLPDQEMLFDSAVNYAGRRLFKN